MEVKASILHEVPEGVERVIVVSKSIRSVLNIPRDKAYLADGMNGIVKECLRKGHLQYVADRARGKAPFLSLTSLVGEAEAKVDEVKIEKPETTPPTAEVERPAAKPLKEAVKKVVKKDGTNRKRSRKGSD